MFTGSDRQRPARFGNVAGWCTETIIVFIDSENISFDANLANLVTDTLYPLL
jgi:hypothetical protein